MNINNLKENIISGYRIRTKEQAEPLLTADLADLSEAADQLRRHFCHDGYEMCTIINGRSGRCPEDCKYCAQSAHYNTPCQEHGFTDEDQIVGEAIANERAGAKRFSLVTSGRALEGQDFDKALSAYRRIGRETNILMCASHGFLTQDQFKMLREAGVSRYHCNIESSREYFPNICTSHSFDQKLENIKRAKAAGLSVCSGLILGMGESAEDWVSMALTLAELDVDSIPINVLQPIKGTPLENQPQLSAEEILRAIAIFRFINPEKTVRMAAGRGILGDCGKRAFLGGANAMIT